MVQLPKRSEVPQEQTWNLDHIFPTKEAWEAEFNEVSSLVSSVTKFKGKLGEGAKTFLACCEALEALMKRLVKVVSYATLHLATDGTNPEYQEMAARASSLATRIRAETSFVMSEALSLPEGTLEKYLAEEPGLEPFRITIQKMIEQKPYRLHPETEEALAALGDVLEAPAMIYERSRTADVSCNPVADSKGNLHPMTFGDHEDHPDIVLRRNAYAETTRVLKAYQNTYAATWCVHIIPIVGDGR